MICEGYHIFFFMRAAVLIKDLDDGKAFFGLGII